jgi:hypothetical protein
LYRDQLESVVQVADAAALVQAAFAFWKRDVRSPNAITALRGYLANL